MLVLWFAACITCALLIIDWKYGNEEEEGAWAASGLKVELMEDPYGIDTKNPAFSWYMNREERGSYQKKYHIVVADTLKNMEKGKYLLDTGWCESSENSYVKIHALQNILKDNSLYYWKVRMMDTQERISEWSEIACFSTGVGKEWSSTETIWNAEKSDYVFLRTTFDLKVSKKKVEKALLSVTALSPEETRQYVFTMYLNGQYIGSGPARLQEGEIPYNTFDVTEYLQKTNILGAICYTNTGKEFLCQLTVFYTDGSKELLVNSGRDAAKWKVFNGEEAYGKNAAMIGTGYYVANAENINGTQYPNNWLEKDFSDKEWEAPVLGSAIAAEHLAPYQTENMQKYVRKPGSLTQIEEGHYLVDFGKEIVGGMGMDVFCKDTTGAEVVLRYGEELDENGRVKYQMRTGNVYEEKWYFAQGKQQYENLGLKTFRYVEIFSEKIAFTEDSIWGFELRQPFGETESSFSSSNELLNRLYDLTKYTVKATNQNLYVDSQSRERAPYEGDAWINMLASYAFSDSYTLARVSNEYLYGNRTWPAEYPMLGVLCAWKDYMYTGNIDSLRENYDLLKENMALYRMDDSYGLIQNNYGEDGFNRPLVDWPTSERDNYAYEEAEYNTVVNAVACAAYTNLADIAGVLGETSDSQRYYQRAEEIKGAMIEKLYNAEIGGFSDGLTKDGKRIEHYSQHATAYALYAQIYTDESMQNQMVDHLKRDNEIKMSVFGAYFLLQGLYDSGAGEYATKLLVEEEETNQHTWAYMLNKSNATITTEAWSTEIKSNMTYSHPWGASPASFIVNGILGIQPIQPAFEEFQIRLQPGELTTAQLKLPTIKGEVKVSYQLTEDGHYSKIKVVVPANTKAYLILERDRVEKEEKLLKGMQVMEGSNDKEISVLLESGIYVLKDGTETQR